MRKHIKTRIAAACFAALASTAVLAQTATPPAAPKGPQAAPRAQSPQSPATTRAFSKPTERIDAQLAYQKTALKITPAQEAQWNAYANHARKQAADMEQRMTRMHADMQARRDAAKPGTPPQRPTSVERLERQQAFLAEASKSVNERLAVQKPLYAALSADQKKVADEVLGRGGKGQGMRGGRGHGKGHDMHGRTASADHQHSHDQRGRMASRDGQRGAHGSNHGSNHGGSHDGGQGMRGEGRRMRG